MNWVSGKDFPDNSWISITYGNQLFVAISYHGKENLITSVDGINWTSRHSDSGNHWTNITYGNNLFVAISSNSLLKL